MEQKSDVKMATVPSVEEKSMTENEPENQETKESNKYTANLVAEIIERGALFIIMNNEIQTRVGDKEFTSGAEYFWTGLLIVLIILVFGFVVLTLMCI